jgi:tyrosine-protein kinase Etk/Wzc
MKESQDILTANLLSALRDLIKYWYLLAISLIIAVSIALLYLKFAAPTFKVQASVLLHIENRNNMAVRSDDILQAFNFMVQDKSFTNEITFLQSLPLIQEAVRDMELRVSYLLQEDKIPKELTFSLRDIYKTSPFIVIPDENHVQPLNILFYINILDEEKYVISGISESASLLNLQNEQVVANNIDMSLNGIYKFGDMIESNYFKFTILLNSNFNPDVYTGKDLFFHFNNLNWIASGFKGSLNVESSALESTIAQLILTTDNVQKGVDFLNSLINTYVERNLEEANFLANKTIEYIDNQLVNISDSLGMSEQQLQTLRSSYSVMNIDEKAQNIYGQLQTMQNQRDESQRRLNYLQQMNEYFLINKDSSKLLAPSALGLNDPLLNNLIQELTTLNTEKQRIISQDQLKNPRLQTIDISIENLKKVIAENLSFSITTTRRELDILIERINDLNTDFNRLPDTQRRLLGIERKFNLNDAVYTSLLERRIQAQILKASRLPDLKLIEPPAYLTVASPKRMIILFLAVFFGSLIPIALILGKKLIYNQIHHAEDVRFISDLSQIGSVPNNPKPKTNVVVNYPRTAITEAFHTLRSNIVYYLQGDKNKVILITSSIPGEGKSFTAINLATSFAQNNSKTILVQFDLRRPSAMFEEFESKTLAGVSSYLINRATLKEIIVPTKIPNLDLLPAGQVPPNPVELISSSRTGDMMKELTNRYDYVIIDSPPYGLVTDSFLLMDYADLKLFVVRLGFSRKKVLSSSFEDIESKGIENLYIVVNSDLNDKSRYSHYSYDETKGGLSLSRLFKRSKR